MDYAISAAATITFIGLKQGMFTGQGRGMTGTIFYDGLGVEKVRPMDHVSRRSRRAFILLASSLSPAHETPRQEFSKLVEPKAFRYAYNDFVADLLPLRDVSAHKAHFGRVGVHRRVNPGMIV